VHNIINWGEIEQTLSNLGLKVFSDTKKPSLLTGFFCIFNKVRYLKDW
jgi:hypothetical protein